MLSQPDCCPLLGSVCGRVRLRGAAIWCNGRSMTATFPNLRMRRTRATAWSRALYRENVLTPADLIWPLFVTEGKSVEEPIATLPGVSRWSVDGIAARAREAAELGIPCVALFPNTPAGKRSDDGAEALNPDKQIGKAQVRTQDP